ncbi:MAG TPA: glycerol-3-phosphate acyltransferase [Candidatus Caenarcaniphilales bacterium]
MTIMQVWGALLLFIICPLIGGLPLTGWITCLATGRQLRELGTGNVSVSAAFYHAGRVAGILAVLVEAGKGIVAVLLARAFFPQEPTWELISLIALVMGRYWIGKGAGTTNVVWGYVVYDWTVALLVFVIGGIGFTLLRERRQGRLGVLVLFPLITALHRQDLSQTVAAVVLGGLMAWIYQKIDDDLDLAAEAAQTDSQRMFKFFRGDRAVLSLDQPLDPLKVGSKAATLSQLKSWGYPVPMGWVLPAGDDPEPLIEMLHPSLESPLVVRSSAVGEDSEQASAAGQYRTILQVTSRSALLDAITECQAFYNQPTAVQYRQDQNIAEANMAVLVQKQVKGVFSGIAFSRDPLRSDANTVAIEGLPGEASRVVSGQVTPERFQVGFPEQSEPPDLQGSLKIVAEGEAGDLPPQLIQQVALLARDLEARFHGIPQDVEWSFDGRTLWLLQSRPVTTLYPIWTRKIAAEVIPGLIRPLTWSINQPLTCGVWGDIFGLTLGSRAQGLNFSQTATLHFSRAYFNASLLGQIFRRMGLPPESLEFLTRGTRLSKPSFNSVIRNGPGLLRLVRQELRLKQDYEQDSQHLMSILNTLADQPVKTLAPAALLNRIDQILEALKRTTYYSILAPLSAALRQALLKVEDEVLDNSQTPEVAALRSLQALAENARPLLDGQEGVRQQSTLWKILAETPEGLATLKQLDQLLERYGYLSEVGTDIAVPTWQEEPSSVYELFISFLLNPPPEISTAVKGKARKRTRQGWLTQIVQRRVKLKGQVAVVYSRLLAELRWTFVALEQLWLRSGLLRQPGDIFFLVLDEVRQIASGDEQRLIDQAPQLVAQRRLQLQKDSELTTVPLVVYGNAPPAPNLNISNRQAAQQLQGIGASPGQAEGRVRVLRNLQSAPEVDRDTILVVPYTDAGWAPLLARAGGLISEVGGRLSHGAIVAREYRIPAVMEITHATQRLRDGQQVRMDGQQGTVELL